MLIYRILNLVTKKSYIGQTTKRIFSERYSGKWYKVTHNEYLKNSVAKHGVENFAIQILEEHVTSVQELDRLEKHYIDKFDCIYPKGYNFAGGGDAVHSLHQDTKDKISEAHAREYDLIDYQGNEIHVINLKKFCQQHGLLYAAMKAMTGRKVLSSHGYALKGTSIESIEYQHKIYKVTNIETREKAEFESIADFCRERNLNTGYMGNLLRGRRQAPYKGWIIEGMDISRWQRKTQRYKQQLRSPSGEIHEVGPSATQFALKHPPLLREDVTLLSSGKAVERKGWSLATISEKEIEVHYETTKRSGVYLFNLNGDTLEINNLSRYCRKHGLSYPNMQKLTNGRMKSYRGYTFLNRKRGHPQKRYAKLALLNSDTGEIVSGRTAAELWSQMRGRLAKNKMFALIRDKISECKNWILKEKQYQPT